MVTIAQAKLQLEEQRKLAEASRQKLEEARRKLPTITQRELRAGGYAGMTGTLRRKEIERAEKEIEARQIQVGGYTEKLSEYEKRITKAEQQRVTAIAAYEKRKAEYEAQFYHAYKRRKRYEKARTARYAPASEEAFCLIEPEIQPLDYCPAPDLPTPKFETKEMFPLVSAAEGVCMIPEFKVKEEPGFVKSLLGGTYQKTPEVTYLESPLNISFVSAYAPGTGQTIITDPLSGREIPPTTEVIVKGEYEPKVKLFEEAYKEFKEFDIKLMEKGEAQKIKEFEMLKDIPILKKFVSPITPREGELFYYDPSKNTLARALPLGMTPYSESVQFYRYEKGEYVPVESKTAVGEVSKIFWKGTEIIEKPYERGLDILGVPKDSLLRKKITITPGIYDIPGQVSLWVAFSPLMETAAAKKEAETIQKQLSKTKFEELSQAYGKIQKELLKKKPGTAQLKYLESIYKKYFTKTPEGKESFKKLVEDLFDKEIFKGVPLDLSVVDVAQTSPIMYEITSQVPRLRQVKLFGGLTADVREVQIDPSKVGEISWGVQKQRDIPFLAQTFFPQEREIQKPRMKLGELSLLAQIPKEKLKLGEVSLVVAAQIPRTTQILAQPQIYKTGQILKQPLKQKYRVIPKQIPRLKPKKPLLLKLKAKKEKEKRLKERRKEPFIPYVKRFGKWIPIGKFRRYQKALEVGRKRIRGTLGASLLMTRAGKPIKQPLPFWMRPGKKRPLVAVEKREYRLSTRPEVREIQMFKRLARKKPKSKKIKLKNLFFR